MVCNWDVGLPAPAWPPTPPYFPAAESALQRGASRGCSSLPRGAAWPVAGTCSSDCPPVSAATWCRLGWLLGAQAVAASPAAAEFAERAQPVTCKCLDQLLPAHRNLFMESNKALPKARSSPSPHGEQPAPMDTGQASVLNPKQGIRAPRGLRFGCPGVWKQGRDAAALLPEALRHRQTPGRRGATAAPAGLCYRRFAGHSSANTSQPPSREVQHLKIKKPIWVCHWASSQHLGSQRLPEPPGPPWLPAALCRSRASLPEAPGPARRSGVPRLHSQASLFPPRSGAQRESSCILKPRMGKARASPSWGGGTEQLPAPAGVAGTGEG